MTPDLRQLRASVDNLEALLNAIELEFVDDPDWQEPSNTSYLTTEDRSNPDILSNVEAMTATNKLIGWFGKDRDGFVGLWQGRDKRHLSSCPVVRLDSEGQYELVAATVADYIAVSMDDEEFENARAVLLDAGFQVEESRETIWNALASFDQPNEFRHQLYNQSRERYGLNPID